jgi:hypothetical protein
VLPHVPISGAATRPLLAILKLVPGKLGRLGMGEWGEVVVE